MLAADRQSSIWSAAYVLRSKLAVLVGLSTDMAALPEIDTSIFIMPSTAAPSPALVPFPVLAFFAPGTTEVPDILNDFIAAGGELAAIGALPLTKDNIEEALSSWTRRSRNTCARGWRTWRCRCFRRCRTCR
jgi:hypothetical protein